MPLLSLRGFLCRRSHLRAFFARDPHNGGVQNTPSTEPAVTRPRMSTALIAEAESLFPPMTANEVFASLLERHKSHSGHTAACGFTEVAIKCDRLHEVLSLLALANMDCADLFRRIYSGELQRLRDAATHLSTIADLKGGE